MKTKKEILKKIKEHESKINEFLKEEEVDIELIHSYLVVRAGLKWVLSSKDLIAKDKFYKKIEYECLCCEASKIF